jgi:hypothetical protein
MSTYSTEFDLTRWEPRGKYVAVYGKQSRTKEKYLGLAGRDDVDCSGKQPFFSLPKNVVVWIGDQADAIETYFLGC